MSSLCKPRISCTHPLNSTLHHTPVHMSQAVTKPSKWMPEKRKTKAVMLSDLPFSAQDTISQSMDTSGGYVQLACVLGYKQLEIDRLTLELQKLHGSPMMELFRKWETRNPTMVCVLKCFKLAQRLKEWEILKEYVPQKYHGNNDDNPDEMNLDAILGVSNGSASKIDGGGAAKKMADEWRPGIPRESSWDDEGNDHPQDGQRKISSDSDGSSIHANLKVGQNKLSPSAPPLSLTPDKVKNFSLETRKDSMSRTQMPTTPEKCTNAPMSSLPSPNKPGIQGSSLMNGNGRGSSQHVQEAFQKLAFATVHSFLYDELKEASNNWSVRYKIGEGSFGDVYKVHLRDTAFAVKRMKAGGVLSDSSDEFCHFKTEVTESRKYNHKNLIQISGYSFGPEICIIYEYMSKGSLLDNLKCKGDLKPLQWKQRISILRGAARGLNYLHVLDKDHPLIHGDIKSANILLDSHFEPKISDLGLAKHAVRANEMGEYTHVTIDNTYMHGTSGYLPTSFVQHPTMKKLMSIRTDVHSFGVVIMETLTGLEAKTTQPNSHSLQLELLVDIVTDYEEDGKCLRLKDRKALDCYPDQLLQDMFQLAMTCTKTRGQPCMKKVLEEIKTIEKRKVEIEAKLSMGERQEKSAPPGIQNNPWTRPINRQEANMVTTRPEHSLQLQNSFHPGIPSLDPRLPPRYSKKFSSNVRSLPMRSNMGAAPNDGMNNHQYSLRSDRSDVSDSADLYQSSESLRLRPGDELFRGVERNMDPRTPLPLDDCSIPLPSEYNHPSLHDKVTPINARKSFLRETSTGQSNQLVSSNSLPGQGQNFTDSKSLSTINADKSSIGETRNYSLPTQLKKQQHVDSTEYDLEPGLFDSSDDNDDDDNDEHEEEEEEQCPEVDPIYENDPTDDLVRERERRERERIREKKMASMSDFQSFTSEGSFQFPEVNEPELNGPPGGEELQKGHGEPTELDANLQNYVRDHTETFGDNSALKSLSHDEAKNNEFRSLQLRRPKDAGGHTSNALDEQCQSLQTVLSRPPTFHQGAPRACDESDDRDSHISVSDEDMVLSAPPGLMQENVSRHDEENRLSQKFELITVSSLSDSGELESLTSPPKNYRPPR